MQVTELHFFLIQCYIFYSILHSSLSFIQSTRHSSFIIPLLRSCITNNTKISRDNRELIISLIKSYII